MKLIYKAFATAAAAALITSATPASAQLKVWEDYTPKEEVVEFTYVKIEEGHLDFYLEGLKSTWVRANEISKSLGQITSYGIYTVPFGSNETNLVLRITYPDMGSLNADKAKYDQFMQAWGAANMQKSNETVRELYNNIREIKGTYILREIVITP